MCYNLKKKKNRTDILIQTSLKRTVERNYSITRQYKFFRPNMNRGKHDIPQKIFKFRRCRGKILSFSLFCQILLCLYLLSIFILFQFFFSFFHLFNLIQSPESRVQSTGSRLQGPDSRVQSPGSRVQSPGSRVQGPVHILYSAPIS